MVKTVDLGKFPKGINNVADETDLPEGSLREANNVFTDDHGNVKKRKGYTKVYTGSETHSLFNGYFAEGSLLKHIDSLGAVTDIEDIEPNRYLAWETILGSDYYSNGDKINKVGGGTLGVPSPQNSFSLSTISGALKAGLYQVAITNIDGEESGTDIALSILVEDGQGIMINNIPNTGYDIVVYCSAQNGTELYKIVTLPAGTSATLINNSEESTYRLETQFMSPLPGGHITRHFNGRLYVANDNILWFSEPHRYGLKKNSSGFFQFPERIKIVQPVIDGLFIVADKTYFLAGMDATDMFQRVVSKDSAIEGTGLALRSSIFGVEGDFNAGYWFSTKGAVIGLPEGNIKLLTESSLAVDEGLDLGVSMLREIDGTKQIITNFNNGGMRSGFGASDQAVMTVIRNGVVLQ